MSHWQVELKGNDVLMKKLASLQDFQALAGPGLEQAMTETEDDLKRRTGRTASQAMTHSVRPLGKSILIGKAGPRAGKSKKGVTVAGALEHGTGLQRVGGGTKHKITPIGQGKRDKAFQKHTRKGEHFQGPAGPSGMKRALSFNNIARASVKGIKPKPWHDAAQNAAGPRVIGALAAGVRKKLDGN